MDLLKIISMGKCTNTNNQFYKTSKTQSVDNTTIRGYVSNTLSSNQNQKSKILNKLQIYPFYKLKST